MEEERRTRRAPLLVALAGIIALAAVWATMALAGGSTSAAKPAKAPAAPAQSSNGPSSVPGKTGGHNCPLRDGTSNDL
jgi:hypothetical protein